MALPDVRNDNVANFLNHEDIVLETAAQIMKDFGLFGITITFSGNTAHAYHELHEQLIGQIADLLDRDYSRLLAVLYQVDITDKEIERTAKELPQYDHVEIVAHQIIVRDLKKVLTRHYFKSNQ